MRKEFKDMTLTELSLSRGTLQNYLDIAVSRARRDGRTWASIGHELGVSPQEAHRRYNWIEKVAPPAEGA